MRNENAPRAEWPMASYMASWKLFRQVSDENEVTAQHILSCPAWPTEQAISILDVGCGNGHVVGRILALCMNGVANVRLLDPDEELLSEAYKHILETRVTDDVITHLGSVSRYIPDVYEGVDVVLAIHVAYLMEPSEFGQMMAALPKGVTTYVVLDRPDSVFSRLWEVTAPKYHGRSVQAHKTLGALPPGFNVEHSVIASHIQNPLARRRQVMESLLSLLCYTDYTSLDAQSRKGVEGILREHTRDGVVTCESSCYEVVRS